MFVGICNGLHLNQKVKSSLNWASLNYNFGNYSTECIQKPEIWRVTEFFKCLHSSSRVFYEFLQFTDSAVLLEHTLYYIKLLFPAAFLLWNILLFHYSLGFFFEMAKIARHYSKDFNPLSANPTRWSTTLKQFVG